MKLLTRLNIILFLFVIQSVGGILLLYGVFLRFPIIYTLGILLSWMSFLVIIKSNEPSSFKLSWVIIVLAILPLGGLFYVLYGNKRATRPIKKHVDEHALIAKYLTDDDFVRVQEERMESLFKHIRQVSAYGAYAGTSVNYYTMGEDMFADMLKELREAKKFIFLEYFIIGKGSMWDEMLDILIDKAKNGVEVRLIIDDFGSMKLFTNRYIRQLRERGVKVVRFNPMRPILFMFMNHRDHRKILVIDGRIAFTGGVNISDEYVNRQSRFGIWKDTGVRLKGEAVWSFTLMFIEMWDTFCKKSERIDNYGFYRSSQVSVLDHDSVVLPFGDNPLDDEQIGEDVYIDILNQSKDYVYIFTPYLVISERMTYALQTARKRGVDVRIVTPGTPDKRLIYRLTRSYYRHLLSAGVKIYEYTPGFMHAKSFVSDDAVAVVGTINLDYRSLYLHFECATLIYGGKVIEEIKADFLDTVAAGTLMKGRVGKKSLFGAFVDGILHLLSPLL